MVRVSSHSIERNSRLAANRYAGVAPDFQNLTEPRVANAFGNNDALDAACAGSQGFKHRQHSIYVRHDVVLADHRFKLNARRRLALWRKYWSCVNARSGTPAGVR